MGKTMTFSLEGRLSPGVNSTLHDQYKTFFHISIRYLICEVHSNNWFGVTLNNNTQILFELQTSMYNVWNMFKMIVLPKTNKRNTGDEFCLNRLKVCNLFNCI
jgi:hypothetical protein